jgi:uncharacterized GH25 family protein
VQPLAAHEFWLEPSDYRPAIGQEITVGLSLGDTFYQGIRAKRVNEDIVKFVANGEGGQAPVGGEPGDSPIGKIAFASRGAYIVEFSNHNRFTELDAEVFERYLVHKGLDNAIAARKERGESDKPGREAFRHCLKTIVVAGDPNAEIHDHALGLELEVISESRLDAGRSGDQLSFKVLYQGAPLKDLLVTATRRDAPTDRVSVRTDANGHVEFDLKDPDVWMIDTVYIMPTPNDEKVEWQSVWASLTFQLFPRR